MHVAARLKLTELAPAAVEAYYKEEIGVGHALLLAKLQPDQQEKTLPPVLKRTGAAAVSPAHPASGSQSSILD
jgi:ParB family chromosome partitioning protein